MRIAARCCLTVGLAAARSFTAGLPAPDYLQRVDIRSDIERLDIGEPADAVLLAFRATGITAYLANGGALEHAQEMAAHESPRTTKLYDRTKERLTQDEVERIRL
jgi:hypothetical protein